MRCGPIFIAMLLLSGLGDSVRASDAPTTRKAPTEAYAPRKGKPHPPLALWDLNHEESISITAYRGKKVLLVHFAPWDETCRKEVPRWYEALAPLVKSEKLVIVGVAHDVYAERARLFVQWKGIDGPILHDPVNHVRLSRLPRFVAIDENGYVRDTAPELKSFSSRFVNRKFPGAPAPIPPNTEEPPLLVVTRREAIQAHMAPEETRHGDALLIRNLPAMLGDAVKFYRRAIKNDPRSAQAHYGLGIALRRRFESEFRRAGDFRLFVAAWKKAAALAPDHQIYQGALAALAPPGNPRRCAYQWMEEARAQLAKRGETPVALSVPPLRTETCGPAAGEASNGDSPSAPKAKDDEDHHVRIEAAVVRSADPGRPTVYELHLALCPDLDRDVRWSSDASLTYVTISSKGGVRARPARLAPLSGKGDGAGVGGGAPLVLSTTVTIDSGGKSGTRLVGAAVYQVRVGDDGAPVTLRQEFSAPIEP